MQLLLMLLIALLAGSDILGVDMSLAPGLSVKNAMLNLIAVALVIRLVLQGNFRLLVPGIQACMILMFSYAMLSMIVVVLIIQVPHYRVLDSIIALKYLLLDSMLFFLAFLYGAGSVKECIALVKAIVLAVTLANAITITNVIGITNIGTTVWGNNDLYEGGRVFGVFGHANETGTLIVCLLPVYIAAADSVRGIWKLFWSGAMMVSIIMLIMTGSRGALGGLVVGAIWAVVICRRFVSLARVWRWGAIFGLIGLPLISLVGWRFGQQYFARIISQAQSMDSSIITSGRTELWADAFLKMIDTPIALITGFGWGVYQAMGFKLIPHNHYFSLWFEIGLVGLIGFILILYQLISTLNSAIPLADPVSRRYLIAGIFSVTILAVTIFFEQLFKPWFYIWPYLGVVVRLALYMREQARSSTTAAQVGPASPPGGTRRKPSPT